MREVAVIQRFAWFVWLLLAVHFMWEPSFRSAVGLPVVTLLLCTSEIVRSLDRQRS